MARPEITLFPGELARELAEKAKPQIVERAKQAAAKARSEAPVVSGAYRDGIGVVVEGDDVYLVDTDPLAAIKEYGTADTPPHSVLTNAGASIGKYGRR
jgi:hypothetical protein